MKSHKIFEDERGRRDVGEVAASGRDEEVRRARKVRGSELRMLRKKSKFSSVL